MGVKQKGDLFYYVSVSTNEIGNRLIDIGGVGIQTKGFIVDVVHLPTRHPHTKKKMWACVRVCLYRLLEGSEKEEKKRICFPHGRHGQGTLTTTKNGRDVSQEKSVKKDEKQTRERKQKIETHGTKSIWLLLFKKPEYLILKGEKKNNKNRSPVYIASHVSLPFDQYKNKKKKMRRKCAASNNSSREDSENTKQRRNKSTRH